MPLPHESQAAADRSRRRRLGVAISAAVIVAAAVAIVGAATVPQAAQAAMPSKLKLKSDGPAMFWNGTVSRDGNPIPSVPECRTVHCDVLQLNVALPDGTWRHPGGVQVAIRWAGATEGGLGLFVYRNGVLRAKSTAAVSIAQSVLLPSAGNGTYQVYVSYGTTFGAVDPDPVIDYEGLVEVEYAPSVRPLRDLIPDLSALPQENVTYDNPGSIFGDTAQPGQSCFDSERDEGGARQCLRFDQVLQDSGAGALELRFDRETGVFQDEDAVQRVYRSDGTFFDLPTGQVEFHAIHGHYHFKGFAQSELWLTDSAGGLVGTAPAAVGDKVSFCVADTDLISWGVKGDGPMSYPAPGCLEPQSGV